MGKFKEYLTDINEAKTANKDTREFIRYMLDNESFFSYINDNIYDGKPDFVKTNAAEIADFFKTVYGKEAPFNSKKVQSGWVFVQLEKGGLERVDFNKDHTNAI